MASIVDLNKNDRKTPHRRRIDIMVGTGKNRKREHIYLGRVFEDDAKEILFYIKRLISSANSGRMPDPIVQHWLETIDDKLHEKLVKAGLCESRTPEPTAPKLAAWLTKYFDQRSNEIAASSVQRLRDTGGRLLKFFGKSMTIDAITADTAADWRASMMEKVAAGELSEATVRTHCRNAKTIFREAVDRELLEKNPFKRLKSSSLAAELKRFVTMDEAAKILDACPTPAWRVFFALMRFGGLRATSETHRLTWDDVNWDKYVMMVPDQKRKRTRLVPIFEDLAPWLEAAFEDAGKVSDPVVTLSQNNLPRDFKKILGRAGIEPWADLFQTLRGSAETQHAMKHPQFAVSAWIGHSMKTSERHYLRMTDEIIAAATGRPIGEPMESAAHFGKSAAVAQRNSAKQCEPVRVEPTGEPDADGERLTGNHEKNQAKTPGLRDDASQCDTVHQVKAQGLEPWTYGLKVRCSTN